MVKRGIEEVRAGRGRYQHQVRRQYAKGRGTVPVYLSMVAISFVCYAVFFFNKQQGSPYLRRLRLDQVCQDIS